MRRLLIVAVIAVVAAAGADGTRAHDRFVYQDLCHEVIAWVSVPMENVRPHLPVGWESRYTLRPDRAGNAQVFVRTYRCENVTVDGVTVPEERGAQVGVVIEAPPGSHDDPDFTECCNWYLLDWSTDSAAMARWLRGGPDPLPATSSANIVQASGFRYDFTPVAGSAPPVGSCTDAPFGSSGIYQFEAFPPTPSPFVLTAAAGPPFLVLPNHLEPSKSGIAYWFDTPRGAVKVVGASCLSIGPASGTVTPAPGTRLAEMLGGTARPFAGLFSANFFVLGTYHKQLVPYW